jgi:hypothetical protein
MKAKVLLSRDADLFWWGLADSVGWLPVLEHYPDRLVEGLDCFAIDYLALDNIQQFLLLGELVRRGEEPHPAQEQAIAGVPISTSQLTTIDVGGLLFSVDEDDLDFLVSYDDPAPGPFPDLDAFFSDREIVSINSSWSFQNG